MFSILTPVYNVEQFIGRAIESVLNQSFKDFELILVDDGSLDNSPEILDEYAKNDERIKVLHKNNGGLVSARKAAAEVCAGEYVIILDGDDFLDENFLQAMFDKIQDTDADMICCGYNEYISENQTKSIPFNHCGLWNRKEIEQYCSTNIFSFPPTLWAKAVRRDLYLDCQMKVSNTISMGEDGVVVYNLLSKCSRVAFIDKALYYYRFNPNSITKNRKKLNNVESFMDRVELLSESLNDVENFHTQLATYVSHGFFNVCLSYFRNYPFFEAKKKLKGSYNQLDRKGFFDKCIECAPKKVKIARCILKNKMFITIKLISWI